MKNILVTNSFDIFSVFFPVSSKAVSLQLGVCLDESGIHQEVKKIRKGEVNTYSSVKVIG